MGSWNTVVWAVLTGKLPYSNIAGVVTSRNNNNNRCALIDVTISGNRNVIKKEADKILKYKDLTIEIQRMWNVKTKVMPVIIGATGTISKSFRK